MVQRLVMVLHRDSAGLVFCWRRERQRPSLLRDGQRPPQGWRVAGSHLQGLKGAWGGSTGHWREGMDSNSWIFPSVGTKTLLCCLRNLLLAWHQDPGCPTATVEIHPSAWGAPSAVHPDRMRKGSFKPAEYGRLVEMGGLNPRTMTVSPFSTISRRWWSSHGYILRKTKES